ncbi:phage tail tape measure protein [Lactiplantibacillus argentoratensis]|uniref:phage tail tape measure protein n=1 Tax=Lactiplantibacillus argentoratensis TaxID=271881 RepID=UPI001D08AF76|nr:phage tail tape measure protein [Lactiplantibacillus argentoratensis]MCB7463381.1 phage tail tape measure protein [Lactiplantibacillus argentoratensis]
MAQVAATFTANISGYTSAMDKMARSTTTATGSISKISSGVSSSMSKIGAITAATGAIITAFGVKSLTSFGQFENSINKAAVIAGGSSKDIKALSDEANKLGQTLPISAQDAADAMVEMAKNGASVKDIKDAFPPIARAAAATGEDLSSTASVVQQSMNLWGGGVKNATKYSALLTVTANKSNVQISDMQQVLANVGGTATNMGMSLKDVASAAGILTNSGIPAAQASQDLNHALVAMEAPSKVASKKMNELGITFADSSGKMKPFPTILKEVAKATDGMGESQKAAALKAMFGTAGMNAMLPLLKSVNGEAKSGNTDWNSWAKALDAAGGSYQKASKYLIQNTNVMQKNVGAQLDQTKDAFTSLTNASYAAQSKGIQSFLMKVQDMIGELAGGNSALDKFVRGFIGLSPAIGPIVTATGGFVTSLGKISGVATSATKGILGLGKGIVGIPGKLLGIGSASKTTTAAMEPLGTATRTSANAAAASAANFLSMGAAIALIGVGVLTASTGIAILVQSAISLSKAGSGAQTVMAALAVGIVAVAGAFALLGPALTTNAVGIGVFGAAVLAVGAGVAAFGLGVKEVAQAISILSSNVSSIVPVLAALGVGFAAMITGFITMTIAAVPQIVSAIMSMMTKLMDVISNQSPEIASSFSKMLISLMTAVSVHAPAIALAFTTMMISIMNAVIENAPALINTFSDMLIALMTSVQTNAPRVITSFSNMMVSIINAITANIDPIVSAISNLIIAMLEALANSTPRFSAAMLVIVGQMAEAFVTQMPILVQLAGATMAAVIAVLATYASKMNDIGGILLQALAAGFTGKKYDAIGAATDVIQSSGAAASSAGQAAFKAAGGNAAIQSAQAIANSTGKHQSAGAAVGRAGASGISSAAGYFTSAGSKDGSAAASGLSSKSGSVQSSGSSVGRSGASGIKSTSGYFTGAGSSAGSAAASGLGSQKRNANSVGRDLGSSSANAVKSGTSGVDLSSNGSSLMSGFLSGIRAGFGPVQSFVSGIAGWIKAHKGPISYDAKLLIPAGNAIMNGLNSGLMNSFSTVQSNVSGMADELAGSINSVASDIKTGDLAMQAASYSSGDMDQNIDTDNWVQPTIVVHNELVGDKIRTIVSQGDADARVHNKFFIN